VEGLDFNLTDSAAVRQFGQWLHHRGFTEPWHAYSQAVRLQYCYDLNQPAAVLDEIDRVMADPYFGVPA